MAIVTRTNEQADALALEWYAKIKVQVEPEHNGELIAINIDTGDYILGADLDEVLDKMQARYPHVAPHVLRVGSLIVDTLGGGSLESQVSL